MKAARVQISCDLLAQMIGLDYGYEISSAQLDHKHYRAPTLELMITGENLSDEFKVDEGDIVKLGVITVHKEYVSAEISLAKESL